VMGRFMVGRGFVAVESDGELRIAHVRGASGPASPSFFRSVPRARRSDTSASAALRQAR
jgi:hypothetical protein